MLALIPHQHHPSRDECSTFRPPIQQRRSAHILIQRVIPDNVYGDLPPIQIKREIRGLPPIQEESVPMEQSTSTPVLTNEEDDIGQMYSTTWIHHHLALAAKTSLIHKQYRDIAKLPKKAHTN